MDLSDDEVLFLEDYKKVCGNVLECFHVLSLLFV